MVLFFWVGHVSAQVPAQLPHQGRIAVGETYFEGTGQFKFALLSGEDDAMAWMNAPDGDADGEPDASVAVPVIRGLYSVHLGDTSLPNMAAVPVSVFGGDEVRLRVWFDDGVSGFERLDPDQPLGAVGYALLAASVPDGAITAAKLAPDALTTLTGALTALTAELHALSNRHQALAASISTNTPGKVPLASSLASDPALLDQGYVAAWSVASPPWTDGTATGSPTERYGHVTVWTGQEVIVYGGNVAVGVPSATGARYRMSLNEWQALPTFAAPSPRMNAGGVWTGSALLVWGGFGTAGYLNDGARFTPSSAAWTALSTNGAPSVRDAHVAVWTGSRMVIWGGRNNSGFLGDGALYDPALDQWTALNLPGAPSARSGATAVWTGNSLLIWGGQGAGGALGTGGRLTFNDPGTPVAWQPLSTANAPGPRFAHTAVWTGDRMLVWGGQQGGVRQADGAAYHPVSDEWQALPTVGGPSARQRHMAVWTGSEMLIQGGDTVTGSVADGFGYHPGSGQWRALSGSGNPQPRSEATAVWADGELVVFGGRANGQLVASLQRLVPQPTWYFYLKP
jgi:hypothetical protein